MTIAATIAAQLGRATFELLGTDHGIDMEDGLLFFIKGSSTVNLIQIYLDPYDTYTVQFCKVESRQHQPRGISFNEMSVQVVSNHTGIYWDMLHDLIEEETGLPTRAEA